MARPTHQQPPGAGRPNDPALERRGCTKRFATNNAGVDDAVRDIDLVVPAGRFVSIVGPTGVQKGQVDAAVMLEPDITVLGKRIGGAPKILADTRTHEQVQRLYGTDTWWPSSTLYAKSDWLQPNPEQAKKLAQAVTKTLQWIRQHPGSEIAAKMPQHYNGGDPTHYATVIDELKKTLATDGKISEAGAQAVLKTQQIANAEVKGKQIDIAGPPPTSFSVAEDVA